MALEVDDLSKDIAAALEIAEGNSAATDTTQSPAIKPGDAAPPSGGDAGTPPPADKSPEGVRARDETGKFVAKPADTTQQPAPSDKQKLAAPETGTAAQAQAPQAQKIAPPTNWKGGGKIEWNRLPQHIQKEIADDYSRFSQVEAPYQRLRAAIGPEREQILSATYGSVEQGIQNLFAISDMATKNPQGFLLWFAQQRGIDISQMAGQGAAQGQHDPAQAPHPLQREVEQLRNQFQQFSQQQTNSLKTQIQTEYESFVADPSHPYINDVRTDMATILNSGQAKGLQEAYDMAVWSRPEIRSQLLEQQLKEREAANAALVQQKKTAAVSITGSPSGARAPLDEPDEDLETTIRRNVERVSSR